MFTQQNLEHELFYFCKKLAHFRSKQLVDFLHVLYPDLMAGTTVKHVQQKNTFKTLPPQYHDFCQKTGKICREINLKLLLTLLGVGFTHFHDKWDKNYDTRCLLFKQMCN